LFVVLQAAWANMGARHSAVMEDEISRRLATFFATTFNSLKLTVSCPQKMLEIWLYFEAGSPSAAFIIWLSSVFSDLFYAGPNFQELEVEMVASTR
jgi:hypothetical protein